MLRVTTARLACAHRDMLWRRGGLANSGSGGRVLRHSLTAATLVDCLRGAEIHYRGRKLTHHAIEQPPH
jgi:hypothetical protein